jgi:AcrR family transcriptional regulator
MKVEHSGRASPERILAMLWRRSRPPGAGGKPALGRKPRLTLDEVVGAAIALADAEGLAAVAMSRVATSLGVGTMTLYTYVRSKAELVDLMVDEVLNERALPAPGEPRPPSWRAQVERFAQQTRTMYRRHPWLRHISTIRPPVGPGMLAEREYVLSTLHGIGLTPQQMVTAALAISAFVDATASLEAESEGIERSTGQSHDAWWQERARLWEDYFDVDRYPTMTFVWKSGGFDKSSAQETAAAHEFGFQRLLDGIQSVIERQGETPRPLDRLPEGQ